jgi:hypothetical protein
MKNIEAGQLQFHFAILNCLLGRLDIVDVLEEFTLAQGQKVGIVAVSC